MKISFFGAARCVTGSCHMLSTARSTVLIDCGMRQGEDAKGEYGNEAFPFDPRSVQAVLITHAHIDHSGLLPLLVKRGFTGAILTTDATAQLSTIMLPDSAHIQEQEAEWQNRKNERAGKAPVEPLYTQADVENTLKLMRGVEYEQKIQLCDDITVRFTDMGHLLGSAAIEIWVREDGKTQKVVFSGDVGRDDRPILCDPQDIDEADYLVMESTYGDRLHDLSTNEEKETELEHVLTKAIARGGNIVIPSFAVGRTQEMLYYIKRLLKKGSVPGLERVPVYIDSPLGINATRVDERCAEGYYDENTKALAADGSPFDFPTLVIAQSSDESKLINTDRAQKIIISSSGMCDAGRIRHHLKHNLFRADSTIVFAGYQAIGTLGRALTDGVKKVKLFGEDVRVNADIVQIDGFSGHADKDELIAWAQAITPKPHRIFLVHGEDSAIEALRDALVSLGQDVAVPAIGDTFELAPSAAPAKKRAGKKPAKAPAGVSPVRPTEAPAPLPAVPTPDADVLPLSSTLAGADATAQMHRIEALIVRCAERRSADMELLRAVFEADLASLADKWERIIK